MCAKIGSNILKTKNAEVYKRGLEKYFYLLVTNQVLIFFNLIRFLFFKRRGEGEHAKYYETIFLKVGTHVGFIREHLKFIFCPFTYISVLINGMKSLSTNRAATFQYSDGTPPSCITSG